MNRRPLLLAHRGDHRRAVENTLPAIAAALDVPGLDGLEFDVQLSGDGVPVLLHDETLARTHGRPERPDELSIDDLRALGVATLGDVLEAVPDRFFLDVELKVDAADAVAAELAPWVRRDGRAIVSSFHPEQLSAFAAAAPGIGRWLNAETLDASAVATAVALGCSAVSARLTTVDAPGVAAAERAGLRVAAWTATRPDEVARLTSLGVVAICVEGPALGG